MLCFCTEARKNPSLCPVPATRVQHPGAIHHTRTCGRSPLQSPPPTPRVQETLQLLTVPAKASVPHGLLHDFPAMLPAPTVLFAQGA